MQYEHSWMESWKNPRDRVATNGSGDNLWWYYFNRARRESADGAIGSKGCSNPSLSGTKQTSTEVTPKLSQAQYGKIDPRPEPQRLPPALAEVNWNEEAVHEDMKTEVKELGLMFRHLGDYFRTLRQRGRCLRDVRPKAGNHP